MSRSPASATSVHSSDRWAGGGDRSLSAAGMPGDHVRQLEYARAGEAGDAEDLAPMDVEVDAAQPACP